MSQRPRRSRSVELSQSGLARIQAVRAHLARVVPVFRSALVVLEDLASDLDVDVGVSLRTVSSAVDGPKTPKVVRVVPRHPTATTHVVPNERPTRPALSSMLPRDAPGEIATPARTLVSRIDAPPSPGEVALLVAIAQHGEEGATREVLALLTGYSKTTVKTVLPDVARRGWTRVVGTRILATQVGVAMLPLGSRPFPRGPELLAFWMRKLKAGPAKLLAAIVAAYPDAVTRARLAEVTGQAKTTVKTNMPKLTVRRLVVERRGRGATAASILIDPEEKTR